MEDRGMNVRTDESAGGGYVKALNPHPPSKSVMCNV